MKLDRHHKIILTVYAILVVTLLGIGAWWAYKRYLSPEIEPSVALYPTRGLDLSGHNGDIDFHQVRHAGYSFVILKATEGISFIDKSFYRNYTAARQAGLKVGAYHFFRFDCDGRTQANHFLTTVGGMAFDFPLVLDVEKSGNPDGHNKQSVIKSLRDAIDHLALRDYQAVIYTNKSGFRDFINNEFTDIPLWICSFSDPPGPDKWYLWQYTHRGSVPGIKGHVDINILSPDVTLPILTDSVTVTTADTPADSLITKKY